MYFYGYQSVLQQHFMCFPYVFLEIVNRLKHVSTNFMSLNKNDICSPSIIHVHFQTRAKSQQAPDSVV